MARNITTLYVNDTSIRLMVTRGKRVSKLADVPLDTSLIDANVEAKEAELVTKIKHLLKTNNIRTKKVIVGLSGLHCISRPAVLPLLPKAMLDEAFLREAKRVFPVPPEQLYISWQVISESDGNMQAFLMAIPRQIADTLLSALDKVGLKPYLMDIKPLALARLVKDSTAIVVDVQAREFDIIIMADGIPQPIRTVSFPQETQSLADKLSIVKDELKRTIQFHNSNNPDKQMPHDATMYISGELIDEPELYESLSQETGFQVAPLTSPLKCLKQLDPSHYLVNVGLALKEFPREGGSLLPNINTLPVPYQPKQLSLNRIMAIPAAATAIGLIVLLAMTIQDADANISSVNSQLDATNFVLEKKQVQKKELIENIAALENQFASAQASRSRFVAAFDGINSVGDKINGNLEETVANMVDDLEISGLDHANSQLSLTGTALSEVEIMEYVRNLDTTGRFSEITITNLSRGAVSANSSSNSTMNFLLSLRLSSD